MKEVIHNPESNVVYRAPFFTRIISFLVAEIFLFSSIPPVWALPEEHHHLRPSSFAKEGGRDKEEFLRELQQAEEAQDGGGRLEVLRGVSEEKIGVLFPYFNMTDLTPEMPRALYEEYPSVRKLYESASRRSGYSIPQLFLEEDPKDSARYQLVTTLYSVALYKALEKNLGRSFKPKFLAGYSSGILAAMVISGAISLEEMVDYLVRGSKVMNDVATKADYALFTIFGVPSRDIERFLEPGEVELLQDVSPEYMVVAAKQGLNFEVLREALSQGTGGKVRLQHPPPVRLPHHTFYEDGRVEIRKIVDSLHIRNPKIPIVASSLREGIVTDASGVTEELREGFFRTVFWSDTIRRMTQNGVTHFLEIGPGKKLSVSNTRLVPDHPTVNVDTDASVQLVSAMIRMNGESAQDGGPRWFKEYVEANQYPGGPIQMIVDTFKRGTRVVLLSDPHPETFDTTYEEFLEALMGRLHHEVGLKKLFIEYPPEGPIWLRLMDYVRSSPSRTLSDKFSGKVMRGLPFVWLPMLRVAERHGIAIVGFDSRQPPGLSEAPSGDDLPRVGGETEKRFTENILRHLKLGDPTERALVIAGTYHVAKTPALKRMGRLLSQTPGLKVTTVFVDVGWGSVSLKQSIFPGDHLLSLLQKTKLPVVAVHHTAVSPIGDLRVFENWVVSDWTNSPAAGTPQHPVVARAQDFDMLIYFGSETAIGQYVQDDMTRAEDQRADDGGREKFFGERRDPLGEKRKRHIPIRNLHPEAWRDLVLSHPMLQDLDPQDPQYRSEKRQREERRAREKLREHVLLALNSVAFNIRPWVSAKEFAREQRNILLKSILPSFLVPYARREFNQIQEGLSSEREGRELGAELDRLRELAQNTFVTETQVQEKEHQWLVRLNVGTVTRPVLVDLHIFPHHMDPLPWSPILLEGRITFSASRDYQFELMAADVGDKRRQWFAASDGGHRRYLSVAELRQKGILLTPDEETIVKYSYQEKKSVNPARASVKLHFPGGEKSVQEVEELIRTLQKKGVSIYPTRRRYPNPDEEDALEVVEEVIRRRGEQGQLSNSASLYKGEEGEVDEALAKIALALQVLHRKTILPYKRMPRFLDTLEDWRRFIDDRLTRGEAITSKAIMRVVAFDDFRKLKQIENQDHVQLALRRKSSRPGFGEFSAKVGKVVWENFSTDRKQRDLNEKAEEVVQILEEHPWQERLALLSLFKTHDRLKDRTDRFLATGAAQRILREFRAPILDREVTAMVRWTGSDQEEATNRVLAWLTLVPEGREAVLQKIQRSESLGRSHRGKKLRDLWPEFQKTPLGQKVSQVLGGAESLSTQKTLGDLQRTPDEEALLDYLRGRKGPVAPSRIAEETSGSEATVVRHVRSLQRKGFPIIETRIGSFYLQKGDPLAAQKGKRGSAQRSHEPLGGSLETDAVEEIPPHFVSATPKYSPKEGERVYHTEYGFGEVVKAEGAKELRRVTIFFEELNAEKGFLLGAVRPHLRIPVRGKEERAKDGSRRLRPDDPVVQEKLEKVRALFKEREQLGLPNHPKALAVSLYEKIRRMEKLLGVDIAPRKRIKRDFETLDGWRHFLQERIIGKKPITYIELARTISRTSFKKIDRLEHAYNVRLALRGQGFTGFVPLSVEVGEALWTHFDPEREEIDPEQDALEVMKALGDDEAMWPVRLALLAEILHHDLLGSRAEAFLKTKVGRELLVGLKGKVMESAEYMVRWTDSRSRLQMTRRILAWLTLAPGEYKEILKQIRSDAKLNKSPFGREVSQALREAREKSEKKAVLTRDEKGLLEYLREQKKPVPPSRVAREVHFRGSRRSGDIAYVERLASQLESKGIHIRGQNGSFVWRRTAKDGSQHQLLRLSFPLISSLHHPSKDPLLISP